MSIVKQIKEEITSYKNTEVELTEGCTFNQSKLVRRIVLYKNCSYPRGKFDSQGGYKYWFDCISPRVYSEIKNIDFDSKDISLASEVQEDAGKVLIANARLRQYMKETGEASRLNEVVERFTEWGNVVWKQVKGDYQIMDLSKFMVLNANAETLDDSDIIESEVLHSVDMRRKIGTWENVEELIDSVKTENQKSSPEFFVYERNGEITEKAYKEAQGKTGGSEKKYILAKVIVGGVQKEDPTQVLFCEEMSEKPYIECHRGTYSNRWMRVGMYEALFDVQTRANEIGNQIARGLEWSSKTVFRSSDTVIAQNILTDLQNGDIIKSVDLQQVNTRMEGLDQLMADWNRLMLLADKIANSYEVVTGENMPSGTPFSLAAQQNANANKLFDFLREKLCIAFQDVVEQWILPKLLSTLKGEDIIKLTGDEAVLQKYYGMIVNEWYLNNLISFPPHGPEETQMIKENKLQELLKNKEAVVKFSKEMWKGFLPRAVVSITGENYNLRVELEDIKSFIQLETDPVRRTALIEMAMVKRNIDTSKLPKTPPMSMNPQNTGMQGAMASAGGQAPAGASNSQQVMQQALSR